MIIGIAGLAGSGKDTVARLIAERIRTKRIVLAEPLKLAAIAMFDTYGVGEAQCFGDSELRGMKLGDLTLEDGTPLTLRTVLQTLGTEWGRDTINKDLWTKIGLARAQRALQLDFECAVITDCRFNNEFKAIRAAGGQLWHLIRHDATMVGGTKAELAHSSEADLQPTEIRYWPLAKLRTAIIHNNGSVEDLRARIDMLIGAHPCLTS